MLLAALHQVDKHYGDQDVLIRATLEVHTGSSIALVGRNGAGKSTILRLLSGQEKPDGGNIYMHDDVHLAMLEQDPSFSPTASIRDIADGAFADLKRLETDLRQLEEKGLDDPTVFDTWEKIHEHYERRGGYSQQSRRDGVLASLGFAGREDEVASHLSGGEKTRLGLGKLLMAQPDVLLLDEPTNHLDMTMRAWLADFLARYTGGVIIVSHDRAFLDDATNNTADIALAKLRTYNDVPSRYYAYRANQLELEAATRANQQKERERIANAASQMKKWAGQNAKLHRRAKSMEKRLARHEDNMLAAPEPLQRTTRFLFPCNDSGEVVLQATNLSKTFDDATLFSDVDVVVRAGERIALVGPNGAGKTTFLKVLLGKEASDDPTQELRYGARVRIGYYDQALGGVDPEATLIEEMIRLVGDTEAHNLLGRFLFPYDAQYKLIKDLSGGERARLALLKLTLGEYNLLVLDEPTNHLDVEMIESLETALMHYTGTLILVSHDRAFISNIANQIWELSDGTFTPYPGGWEYYQSKKSNQAELAKETAQASKSHKKHKKAEHDKTVKKKIPSKWELERTLETLEAKISELEEALTNTTEKLSQPEILDTETIADLGAQHTALETTLLEAIADWDEASELLEQKLAT